MLASVPTPSEQNLSALGSAFIVAGLIVGFLHIGRENATSSEVSADDRRHLLNRGSNAALLFSGFTQLLAPMPIRACGVFNSQMNHSAA
jgi:hypothetical protein